MAVELRAPPEGLATLLLVATLLAGCVATQRVRLEGRDAFTWQAALAEVARVLASRPGVSDVRVTDEAATFTRRRAIGRRVVTEQVELAFSSIREVSVVAETLTLADVALGFRVEVALEGGRFVEVPGTLDQGEAEAVARALRRLTDPRPRPDLRDADYPPPTGTSPGRPDTAAIASGLDAPEPLGDEGLDAELDLALRRAAEAPPEQQRGSPPLAPAPMGEPSDAEARATYEAAGNYWLGILLQLDGSVERFVRPGRLEGGRFHRFGARARLDLTDWLRLRGAVSWGRFSADATHGAGSFTLVPLSCRLSLASQELLLDGRAAVGPLDLEAGVGVRHVAWRTRLTVDTYGGGVGDEALEAVLPQLDVRATWRELPLDVAAGGTVDLTAGVTGGYVRTQGREASILDADLAIRVGWRSARGIRLDLTLGAHAGAVHLREGPGGLRRAFVFGILRWESRRERVVAHALGPWFAVAVGF